MQKETYQIRRLPKNSIEADCQKCNRDRTFFRIVGSTFPGIDQSFKIRPKAANFARRNDNVYVVLHEAEGEETKCMFLFDFVYSTFSGEIAEIRLCRCLSKHEVKRHRDVVRDIIKGRSNILELFLENDSCHFTIISEE